jgi:hypothetical protein
MILSSYKKESGASIIIQRNLILSSYLSKVTYVRYETIILIYIGFLWFCSFGSVPDPDFLQRPTLFVVVVVSCCVLAVHFEVRHCRGR